MAKAASPPRFNRGHFYDPNFTAEITAKMQVPKRIKVTGFNDDEDFDIAPKIPFQEKFDMRVPERILVTGEDGHIGTPAPPRELIMENTIMPPDPGLIRVQTPPRSITLDEHYFPSAADVFEMDNEDNIEHNSFKRNKEYAAEDVQNSFLLEQTVNPREFSMTGRSNGSFLKTEDEIVHLRKQLVKMNRRVLNIEREITSKQQRDKILFGVAAAYFVMKVFMWMNRNS